MMNILILAGGSGTRLWPLSRTHFPKQFLRLDGQESFLQKTVRRNLPLADALYVLTNEAYFHEVSRQLEEIDPKLLEGILLEPDQKNTAPALAYALQQIEKGELFFITPADHLISPVETYWEAAKRAKKRAQNGDLVTFGVRPTRPETGYGYIKAAGERVEEFVEKPDLRTARRYLEDGRYFWNSGMFAFTREAFEREARAHAPELVDCPFSAMPEISFDYAIMEKSKRVAMVALELSWSDIGSWDNLYEYLDKDEQQNAVRGEVVLHNTRESLVYAEKRLVATIGVEKLLVVETDDVVLVSQRECSQDVKEIVGKLRKLGKKEVSEHLTTHRPWGSYTVLMEGERHKIKKIEVSPRQKLSLQMHYHRSEHWVVVSGTAEVTIGEEKRVVHEGESIFVPKSAIHRVENPGKVPLEIIEVQVGEYLGEDDIVRFEDVYGRLKEDEAFNVLMKEFL